jgi:hypothetical protein
MLAFENGILFQDTYFSINENVVKPVDSAQHGYHGHHGPEGNKRYFDLVVKPKLQEILGQ